MSDRILVVEEKHGSRYFDARTDDLLFAAALKLIGERMDSRYAFIVKPDEPEYEKELTDDQIRALPEGSSPRRVAEEIKKQNLRRRREYDDELLWYDTAVKAVKEKNGKLAFSVLRHRQDYEYEGFTFASLDKV